MSRRLNLLGFSLSKMKSLCGSKDEAALAQLCARLSRDFSDLDTEDSTKIREILEKAIWEGIPFRDLEEENWRHVDAASRLARFEQDWLQTDASHYYATALVEGLRKSCRLGSPEAQAFVRSVCAGLPLFWRRLAEDVCYGMVPRARLRFFLPHLSDLADVLEHRVNRKKSATNEDLAGAKFAREFCGWLTEIATADRDLWFSLG